MYFENLNNNIMGGGAGIKDYRLWANVGRSKFMRILFEKPIKQRNNNANNNAIIKVMIRA